MKKIIVLAIIAILIIGAVWILNRPETLPAHEYPLRKETLSGAMKQYALPEELYIEEEEFEYEGVDSTSYTVRNPNQAVNAGACFNILTHKSGENRSIGISFATIDQKEVLTQEECRTAIQMVTYLYGGFQSDLRVYNQLIKVYDFTEEFAWEQEVDGVDVQIAFSPKRNRMTMSLATDKTVFAKKG